VRSVSELGVNARIGSRARAKVRVTVRVGVWLG
jgi:hypothetical protein